MLTILPTQREHAALAQAGPLTTRTGPFDRVAKQHGSRSGAIERVLQDWYREQQLEQLNRETELYYRALTASERLEDREWSDLSSTQAGRLWD